MQPQFTMQFQDLSLTDKATLRSLVQPTPILPSVLPGNLSVSLLKIMSEHSCLVQPVFVRVTLWGNKSEVQPSGWWETCSSRMYPLSRCLRLMCQVYSVFDYTNNQIGFGAKTATGGSTNSVVAQSFVAESGAGALLHGSGKILIYGLGSIMLSIILFFWEVWIGIYLDTLWENSCCFLFA